MCTYEYYLNFHHLHWHGLKCEYKHKRHRFDWNQPGAGEDKQTGPGIAVNARTVSASSITLNVAG